MRALAACLFVLVGCAPEAAVWLRIEAPLRVPDECDAVELKATRVADGAEVYAAHHDLSRGPIPFPLELALSTDDPANLGDGTISLEVKALKGADLATPWSARTQRLDLHRRQWTEAKVEICDCVP